MNTYKFYLGMRVSKNPKDLICESLPYIQYFLKIEYHDLK